MLSKQNNLMEDVPQKLVDDLISLYNNGQSKTVFDKSQSLSKQYPKSFMVWNILGAASARIGMLDEAIDAYKNCISLKPHFAEAYSNMGVALYNQGKEDEALLAYEKAISLKPDYIEAYRNMGVTLQGLGRYLEAIEAYNKCISINPNYVEAYFNIGVALNDQGKINEAIHAYKKILLINPNYAKAYNNIGNSLKEQGHFVEAIEYYNKCISLQPDYANAYYNMGNIFKEQSNFDKAISSYEQAIKFKPNYAEAYSNLGITLQDQGKLDEAIFAYRKSLTLKPDYAEAYSNLGVALRDQGKIHESITALKKSLSLNPDFARAYNNLGNTLLDKGDLKKATEAYTKAISLDPDYAEAHHNLSFSLLGSGKLKEGLDKNEWRWKTKIVSSSERHFSQPLWDGKESLKGKRILIWCEQGIGDTLNWASRLSLISSQADHCILECQDKLVSLLERSFPDIEIKPQNRSLDQKRNDFDVHLPMGSLYRHFIEEILKKPKVDPYLVPDPVRVNFWKERLNSLGKGPYIGVSWKSSNITPDRLPNYASISEWYPILTIPDVTFINLQYVDFADDLQKIKDNFGITVHHFDDLDQFNNIDDVAALSAALDMVVSTKVTPPIITSGVGTPTKIANWRQSPWNNILLNPTSLTVDIFERDTFETWENTFCLIKEDIFKFQNKNKK